ncbi:MAG: HypC/HybG/HupF family hydrogenase formation chaperone [Coriobacteriia bacterium]|nr:HypC/HybG/HupF family hydrogenase formation chaperone [Coriobacteriia bacterium]MBN2822905.1 HypC/HybG/HupF family hydrogenase formation chaperone [Coriobacteriia bacterium]
MCLAIPAKIVEQPEGSPVATVDILGVTRQVNVMMVPNAKPGDHILVHAGFAIEVISEQFAAETLEIIKEYGIPTEYEEVGPEAEAS